MTRKLFTVYGLLFLLCASLSAYAQQDSVSKPIALQCDALNTPMGLDTKQPLLSWKLQDSRTGARQTAYRILVASDSSLLEKGNADVWDSGRVESDRSVDVPYGGPTLAPTTRYYWRVQVWDQNGKTYPQSDVSWWETGLLDASGWKAQWIGYEDVEQSSVRQADAKWITNAEVTSYKGDADTRHDFRLGFELPKSVKTAALYVTGQDTAAAWINSKQVLLPQPLPPWGRSPWKTYTRKDVASELHAGQNLLAVEVVLHGNKDQSQAPMSAALYLQMADGSIRVLKTGSPEWKAQFNAQGNWFDADYDDAGWAQAVLFRPKQGPFESPDTLGNPLPTSAVAVLRHGFSVTKPVVSARLYATALGSYKFSLNGNVVGNQVLSPGWTDYRERTTYQVYDVTSLLQKKKNVIGAYLAPGWYSTPLEWIGQGNNYGDTPDALKAQLRIKYADGSVEWIQTDASWKADISPITFAELYDGETYDARRRQAGWDKVSFSDRRWHPVSVIHPHEPQIVWQSFQPVRAHQVLAAKTVTNPKPGIFVYDFGQNLAGVARIRIEGKAGTNVQLRYSELLNTDGTLYVANLRNAKATDHYIFDGKGVEEYQPSFTYHGFRYVEVSGVQENPGLTAVSAVVLHTDAPETAQLKTGSPMVNQLWSNILWGQRSNFMSVPTDCPQRDERLGWAADAQVFWRTASFNMDLTAFSRKYAADLRGTQVGTPMYGIYAPGTGKINPGFGTGWSDAGVVIPWTSWIQTGDTSVIEQNWDAMTKYLAAINSANPDHLWKNQYGIAFGDWLSPEGPTAEDLIATAYWAYDVTLMEQMAHALNKHDEELKYADLFQKIKAAFNHAYVRPDGFVGAVIPHPGAKVTDNAQPVETQTGYVLALHMDLLPESMRPLAAKRLVDRIAANQWKLGTGFLGTPYLMGVLTDTGHADVAYRLLLNTEYPSWGYMVEHGATTMWERWNGDKMLGDPGMNSFNHYAYGSVAEWIYRYGAGVDTTAADAGFHTIVLHPNFDTRLGSLDFSYESRYGTIHSAWTTSPNEAEWNLTIPPNTTGHLLLSSARAQTYIMDGKGLTKNVLVRVIAKHEGENVYELPAGTYSFKVQISKP